jgi:hypothetical protein
LNAFRCPVADKVENIGPLERVAAGEDENGTVHGGNLIDQVLALFV